MKRAYRVVAVFALAALAMPAADDATKKVVVRKVTQRAVVRREVGQQVRAEQNAEAIGGLAGTITGLLIRHMLDNRAKNEQAEFVDTHSNPGASITYQTDRPALGDFGGNRPGYLDVALVPAPVAVAQPVAETPVVKTTTSGVRIIGLD